MTTYNNSEPQIFPTDFKVYSFKEYIVYSMAIHYGFSNAHSSFVGKLYCIIICIVAIRFVVIVRVSKDLPGIVIFPKSKDCKPSAYIRACYGCIYIIPYSMKFWWRKRNFW